MNKSENYLAVAVATAKEAGKIFKANFGKPAKISLKGNNPRDLVTEIDSRLEKLTKERLHKKFPNHDILGEESGLSNFHKQTNYQWFIDPIDGTSNYIHGFPFCCISIALWDKQGPLVGVIYNPVLDYLFTAERGKGAFLNNKRITVSKQSKLNNAFGGYGWGRDVQKASKNFPIFVKGLNKIRTLGSTTMELCFVAAGVYDFHIQAHLSIWDFAAAVLIITEAGGKTTNWQGKTPSVKTTNLIASNARLHPQLFSKTKKLI